jgi:uncharacterized protein
VALPSPSPAGTAVVTGASSGLGVDFARELAARGHGVTLVARREDRLRELAAELGNAVRTEVIVCDLADSRDRAHLFQEIARRGLTVDILVNNAGIFRAGTVADSTVENAIALVRVNVEAVTDLTTRAVQLMVPRGRGAILNVGSVASFAPGPGQSGYSGTKAFVRYYTEALRVELAGTGVTVATLYPGPVKTEMLKAAGAEEAFANAFPEFMWTPARTVAKAGIDALDADRGRVVPGVPTKITTSLSRLIPWRVLLPLVAKNHPTFRQPDARSSVAP